MHGRKNIKKIVEKIKREIFNAHQFFLKESCTLLDNVEKHFKTWQATDDNMAHALSRLDT